MTHGLTTVIGDGARRNARAAFYPCALTCVVTRANSRRTICTTCNNSLLGSAHGKHTLLNAGRPRKIRRGPIHWPTRARDEVQIGGCILLRRPAASACVCLGLPSHARCFVLLYPALHARRSAHALLPGSHSTRAGHRDTPSRKRLFNANSIWVTELRQFPGAVVFGRGWRRWRGRRGRRGIFVCCSLQVA